jgi:hypothetical protein
MSRGLRAPGPRWRRPGPSRTAVREALHGPRLQTKLTVGPPDDSPDASPLTVQRQVAAPVRKPPFDDLPADLRAVFIASFAAGKFGCHGGVDAVSCFNRLAASARLVLTSLYNRFKLFDLWGHVLYAGGIWATGVGGAHFIVQDHRSFFSSLLRAGRFCVDTWLGGMLHRGATSLREVSTSDSLHVSIGARNNVSAHIDAVSPVDERGPGGKCLYHPSRAVAHIGREAVPDVSARASGSELLRGFQLFPEPRPTVGVPERGETPPEFIRFEIRFP